MTNINIFGISVSSLMESVLNFIKNVAEPCLGKMKLCQKMFLGKRELKNIFHKKRELCK